VANAFAQTTFTPARAALAPGGGSGPVVLPPDGHPLGKTYAGWSAAWWKFNLEQPATHNPILDTTGADCANGQSGPVFFLDGAFGGGTLTRNCAVPSGKALFFPVVNCENDNTQPVGTPRTTLTADQLRAFCQTNMANAHDLSASLDGQDIPGLDAPSKYRVASPPFSVVVPEDSIYTHFGLAVTPGETITPAVSDGFWLMLAPLTAGSHVVHFHAQIGTDPALDVTYNLTIGA
jgi:hypothetical protein